MNYPFWDIPYLGSGWVIGLIAIFHVMISQFAVGGGLYLPLAERKALKMTDPKAKAAWLSQLASHSKFFLFLTAVFGTVSGVGIWFAIGLTHPEATSTLIHNFVFGWAMEWVFFMVELTTIAVYYYTWNRIDERLHLKVGWVYGGASAATLIIINGILSRLMVSSLKYNMRTHCAAPSIGFCARATTEINQPITPRPATNSTRNRPTTPQFVTTARFHTSNPLLSNVRSRTASR